MNQNETDALIDDALTYLKELLPPKIEKVNLHSYPKIEPKKSPLPLSNSSKSKTQIKEKSFSSQSFIKLEAPTIPKENATLLMRKTLKRIEPSLYLHETIAARYQETQITAPWQGKQKNPAIIIFFQGEKHRGFMNRIARAIDLQLDCCQIIEIESDTKGDIFLDSKNLKLVIIPHFLFYQKYVQQKMEKLKKIPLLHLHDLSLYLKKPYLKRSLWNLIKRSIASNKK